MIKWIKKNLLFVIFAAVALILIIMKIDGYIDNRNYRKEIKGLNQDITFLKQDIKKEADKTRAALNEAKIAEGEAAKEREEKKKHKANAARIEKEKKGLQEKIAALPPTQIVVHTVEILRVNPKTDLVDLDFDKEITLQEQGVLFTLVGARRNLEYLKEFSLVKEQVGELRLSLAKSEKADAETQKANKKMKVAVASQKKQIDAWPEIELKWDEKYKKSEQKGKRARAKGRKEGTIIGATVVTILWIFLGK